MGFYDFKGFYRSWGDGFYDAKGNFRSWGDGFYDAKGNFCSWGDGFYDAKGNFCSWGDGFYDAKGNFCSPPGKSTKGTSEIGNLYLGVLLFPLAVIYMFMSFFIESVRSHFLLSVTICLLTCLGGAIFLSKKNGLNIFKRTISFIGNYLCLYSLSYCFFLYLVPSKSVFDGILSTLLCIGLVAIAIALNNLHEIPIIELITGIICLCLVIASVNSNGSSTEKIVELCNIDEAILKILFPFIE